MFLVSVEQYKLMAALNMLKNTVGNNSQGVGDDCISMETDANSSVLRMYTTNSVEYTYVEINVSMANPNEKAPYVNFSRLKAIIESIDRSNMVKISATGANTIHISTSAFSSNNKGIMVMGNNNGFLPLPNTANLPMEEYIIQARPFKTALMSAKCIISKSESMPTLNCMNVGIGTGQITYLAMNRTGQIYIQEHSCHTYSQRTAPLLINPENVVKIKQLIELCPDIIVRDYGNKFITIEPDLTSTSMNYSFNNFVYYSSVYAGTFPTQIATQVSPGVSAKITDIKDVVEVLIRAKAIYDKTNVISNGIHISLGKQKINFKMSSSYGEIDEDVSVVGTGAMINGDYNPEILLKLFSFLANDNITEVNISNMPGNSYLVIEPVRANGSITEKFVVVGITQTTNNGGNP